MLSKTPFFRLFLFLGLGVWVQWQWMVPTPLAWVLVGLGMGGVVVSFFMKRVQGYEFRFLFGMGVGCVLFSGGIWLTKEVQRDLGWGISEGRYCYEGIVLDEPVEKPKTLMCKVRIERAEGVVHSEAAGKMGMIYVSKDSLAWTLVAGDRIRFRGDLAEAANYMKGRSVVATGFVAANQWAKVEDAPVSFSIRLKALEGRRFLVRRLQAMIPDPRNWAIACALMLGYQNDIDEELLGAVREVGAAHILAISGTHFGILFGVLHFLAIRFWGNTRRKLVVRHLVLLPLAWWFAFLTGFSSSVVRAVVMLSIWGVGDILKRKSFSLNTVAMAAFIMLLMNPLYLFDAGCQLSFGAALGIVILHPYLWGVYESKNPAIQSCWGVISVSIAAQAGVLPFTTYYFHQFPVAFLLTNLILLPLSTILLLVIPVSFLIQEVLGSVGWLMYPVNSLLKLFIVVVEELNRLSRFNLRDLYIDRWDAFAVFLAVVFVSALLIKKRAFYLCLLVLLLVFQMIYHMK